MYYLYSCYLSLPYHPIRQAIDEFEMLKDGDRILICLSGSSASLSLLHAIRQFSRARGLQIELGAVSLGSSGVDPRALMLYLRDLNVKYIFEQLSKDRIKNKSSNYLCVPQFNRK